MIPDCSHNCKLNYLKIIDAIFFFFVSIIFFWRSTGLVFFLGVSLGKSLGNFPCLLKGSGQTAEPGHMITKFPVDVYYTYDFLLQWNIVLQAPVVQKVDSAIHQIKIYPVDNTIGSPNT